MIQELLNGIATIRPPTVSIASHDIFLAKYDSAGAFQWARKSGSHDEYEGLGVATYFQGNAYVSGGFSGTATFGSTNLTGSGEDDLFVARIDETPKSPITVIPGNKPPRVSITSPANGAIFTAPAAITLQAEASDTDPSGAVVKVEFFENNAKLGESNFSPYEVVWTNVLTGVYSITGRATDNQGATAASAPVL